MSTTANIELKTPNKRQRDEDCDNADVDPGCAECLLKRRRIEEVEKQPTSDASQGVPEPTEQDDSSTTETTSSDGDIVDHRDLTTFDATREITDTLRFVCYVLLLTFLISFVGSLTCPSATVKYFEYIADLDFYSYGSSIRPRVHHTIDCWGLEPTQDVIG